MQAHGAAIANFGTIDGSISFATQTLANNPDGDEIINHGAIYGDISLGVADDTYTHRGAAIVSGVIDGGIHENDTANFEGVSGEIMVGGLSSFERVNFDIDQSAVANFDITQYDLADFSDILVSISGGELSFNGYTDHNLHVAEDAALLGEATIRGDLDLHGGIGTMSGTIVIDGDAVFRRTSTVDLALGTGRDNSLVVNGLTSIEGGEVNVNISGADPVTIDLSTLMTFNGGTSGAFGNLKIQNGAGRTAAIANAAGVLGLFDAISIQSGMVSVNGEIAGDLYIDKAAIFSGNGVIGGDLVARGAVAPGGPGGFGSIAINGDLSLTPFSAISIDFESTGVAEIAVDEITIAGIAEIEGAALALNAIGAHPVRPIEFVAIKAKRISGEFSAVSVQGFSGLVSVSDGADGTISVSLTPQIALSDGASATMIAVRNYINHLIASGAGNTASDELVASLFPLSQDSAHLGGALYSLQPEAHAATLGIGVEQALATAEIVRKRILQSAPPDKGAKFWLAGVGAYARYEGGRGGIDAASFDVDLTGLLGGAEIIRQGVLLGAYGGVIVADQESRTGLFQTEADGFTAGAYAGITRNGFSAIGSAGYYWGDAETKRTVLSVTDRLQSNYDVSVFSLQGQLRRSFDVNAIELTPTLGFIFADARRDALEEVAAPAALEVMRQSQRYLYVDIGGAAKKQFSKINTEFYAGWRHEALGSESLADASLAGTGFSGLVGAAAGFDRNRLVLGADVKATVVRSIDLFVSYRAELGEDYTRNKVTGGVAVEF